ncbi:MAG: beta-ketoacyl-[acyl-carrier-protein] synthase family protein [Deltaproteobacteria bacterium]|nr:beta-ketoacyl-[acyl-carrier-protein] synthase family protein [Deltaproteobacteria bacterium]
MPDARPVILGFDAVSPLGTDLDEQWARARTGESGVGPLTRFRLDPGFPVGVAGQVPAFDDAPYPFLAPRPMAHWTSPVFRHALLVVHRALRRAGVTLGPDLAPRAAVTFGTAIGGLDAILAADRELAASAKLPSPFANPNACVSMVAGKVSILAGATGPVVTPITACATGSTSLALGGMLLGAGEADLAICGAVDFPLVEPIVAGFATMNGAYKRKPGREDEPPARASRPFSADRRGFVVAEGAACLVLATPDFARAHGLEPRWELAGWCMNGDADHFVAPRRETIARCMAGAIAHAGLAPADIGAVNAHATSTKVGDRTEADALDDVFRGRVPPVTANKSLTGHAMGASSALEIVLALEGLRDGILPPTINHSPDPEIRLDCVSEGARRLPHEHVLKNAFGFGGANTCVVLRRLV